MLYNHLKAVKPKKKAAHLWCTVLALNFIDNGVCTKGTVFYKSCTNSVVLICIFLKRCTTI